MAVELLETWAATRLIRVVLSAYGGIREISVAEPAPGEVGFLRVVSTKVQSSPFAPQGPVCKYLTEHETPGQGKDHEETQSYAMAEMRGPLLLYGPPVERVLPLALSIGYSHS